MIKNKKIKKSWSESDLIILIWVISKYCSSQNIKDIKNGIVIVISFRMNHIGIEFLTSSQVQPEKPACLSGSVSRRTA
jgi:hypothetical protein